MFKKIIFSVLSLSLLSLQSCSSDKEYEDTFTFDYSAIEKGITIDNYYSSHTDTSLDVYAFAGTDSLHFHVRFAPKSYLVNQYELSPLGPHKLSYTRNGIIQEAEAGYINIDYLNKFSDFTFQAFYNAGKDTIKNGVGTNIWITKNTLDTIIE